MRHQTVGSLVGALTLLLAAVTASALSSPAAAEPLNRCAPSENGYPVLDSLTFGPQVVDARQASQVVQVTAQAHDTGGPGPRTGIERFTLSLTNGRAVVMSYAGGHTWRGTTVVPRWSRSGTLAPDRAQLWDRAFFHDRRALVPDEGPDFDTGYWRGGSAVGQHDWSEVAGDHSVEVLSVVDPDPPTITDVDVYPASVDTRLHTKSLYITARAFDGGSGVRDGNATFSQGIGYGAFRATVHLRVLPGRHGLLRGRLVVPRSIGDARMLVTVVVRNNASKRRQLTSAQLLERGLPSAVQVDSGPRPPAGRSRVRLVTASTRYADVRTEDKVVTYRIRVTNRDGLIERVAFDMWPHLQARYRQPTRISGDRHDGVWLVTAVVDSCLARSGLLEPRVTAWDRLRTDGRALPKLTVVAEDRTTPSFYEWNLVDGRIVFTSQFDGEPMNGISNASMPVRRKPGDRPVTGSWTCATLDGSPTDCATGSVRTATFAPDTALGDGELYSVRVNPEGNLDVTDLAGNPAHPQEFYVTAE